MRVICDCGKEIPVTEIGVNGSDYFKCECGNCYNVFSSREEESDE